MTYPELTPQELLARGPGAPEINDFPWLVRWDRVGGDAETLVRQLLPETLDFHTSGTTGPSECWRRTREQLWTEAGMLAELLLRERPEAVLSCAPARHVYGALATLLVPARLRLPVWYRPDYFGAMPRRTGGRWAVVAVPWSFSVLRRKREWVGASDHLAVLHSTAMLPSAAMDFVDECGERRVSVTEVFGSTETGGIAWRVWSREDPPWDLFDDVTFLEAETAEDAGADGEAAHHGADDTEPDVPLKVRSPRLAARPGQAPLDCWQTDDLVRRRGARQFRFSGRRSQLVKINGRRVNIAALEGALRSVIDCADLACLPVADELSGEHLELLVVPLPGGRLDRVAVRAVVADQGFTVHPRQVHVVDRIDRSDTGQVHRPPHLFPADMGAAT